MPPATRQRATSTENLFEERPFPNRPEELPHRGSPAYEQRNVRNHTCTPLPLAHPIDYFVLFSQFRRDPIRNQLSSSGVGIHGCLRDTTLVLLTYELIMALTAKLFLVHGPLSPRQLIPNRDLPGPD